MRDVCTDQEMAQLLERARHRDAAALDALYRLYVEKVYRYIWYRVGDQATAEDLAGEVFVRMVQHLPNFRPPEENQVATFSAWLFRIAGNCITDHRRSRARTETSLEEHGAEPSREESWEPHEEQLVHRHDLLQALNQLSESQRQVLYYRFVADLTSAQTAAAMGKQESAVKALQHRALATLRRLLEEQTGRSEPSGRLR
ncbi:MAG: sigma-70 family RNA polymerase sigma factor [Anaerolineae bacterium]|nr:sigma-70 family RNA polymerase sigma factor [Anaerolineae bacterium]